MEDRALWKKQVGKRLQAARKDKGLTQEKLSELIGLEHRSYANIEGGSRLFSVEVLIRLVEVLEVSADYILLGKHHANTPIAHALNHMDPDNAIRLESIIRLFQDAANGL